MEEKESLHYPEWIDALKEEEKPNLKDKHQISNMMEPAGPVVSDILGKLGTDKHLNIPTI